MDNWLIAFLDHQASAMRMPGVKLKGLAIFGGCSSLMVELALK
jgi:hypothetical protein